MLLIENTFIRKRTRPLVKTDEVLNVCSLQLCLLSVATFLPKKFRNLFTFLFV